MSLDKAIKHGREHRKPYYKKSKRDDRTCRNHGGCPACRKARKRKLMRQAPYEEDR